MSTQLPNYVTVVFACLAVALVTSSASEPVSSDATPRTVTVYGVAETRVPPNRVIITFRVRSLHKDLAQAKSQNDKSLEELKAVLHRESVKSTDIHTGYIRVAEDYHVSHRHREFLGYEVKRWIVVTLTDAAHYENLLGSALNAGVTHIDGVRFETTDLRMYRDLSREKAARAARQKAEALANEFSARIGPVVSIEEVSDGWNPEYGGSLGSNTASTIGSAAVSDGATATGLITIRSAVRIVFELQ